MKMENRAVTFPQTRTILNGVKVPNVSLDDIQAILNMRDAWKYLLGTIREPVDIGYFCKLNELIASNEALEWGRLRTGSVGISGTDYVPPFRNTKRSKKGWNRFFFHMQLLQRKHWKPLYGAPTGSFSGTATSEPVEPCQ